MPVNLVPVDAFPPNFRAPDDGDPANGATFQAGLQDAADAATNLKARLDESIPLTEKLSGAGTWTKDPQARWIRMIAVGSGAGGNGAGGTLDGNGGGGGGSGYLAEVEGPADQFPASMTYAVGASVSGGSAGNQGSNGQDTTIEGGGLKLVAPGGKASAVNVNGGDGFSGGGSGANASGTGGDGGSGGANGGDAAGNGGAGLLEALNLPTRVGGAGGSGGAGGGSGDNGGGGGGGGGPLYDPVVAAQDGANGSGAGAGAGGKGGRGYGAGGGGGGADASGGGKGGDSAPGIIIVMTWRNRAASP